MAERTYRVTLDLTDAEIRAIRATWSGMRFTWVHGVEASVLSHADKVAMKSVAEKVDASLVETEQFQAKSVIEGAKSYYEVATLVDGWYTERQAPTDRITGERSTLILAIERYCQEREVRLACVEQTLASLRVQYDADKEQWRQASLAERQRADAARETQRGIDARIAALTAKTNQHLAPEHLMAHVEQSVLAAPTRDEE